MAIYLDRRQLIRTLGSGAAALTGVALAPALRQPSTLRARFGDWRPCRTTRVIGTGIPGAKLVCELTAVALTEERVD